MTRQAQWRHQHQVESEVETGEVGSLEQKGFGGAGDPPSLARRQRRRGDCELSPRLDLASLDLRFDLMLVAPLRLPRHWRGAWRADD